MALFRMKQAHFYDSVPAVCQTIFRHRPKKKKRNKKKVERN